MAMAVGSPQRPFSGLGRDECRGEACRAPQADRHSFRLSRLLAGVRRSRNRRSVGTAGSEARGPTAGVAGSGLSGTAGRMLTMKEIITLPWRSLYFDNYPKSTKNIGTKILRGATSERDWKDVVNFIRINN